MSIEAQATRRTKRAALKAEANARPSHPIHIRLTADHPTFQHIALCAELAAIEFHDKMLAMLTREGIIDPRTAADRASRAFRRRLHKQFGLTGKYVGH